MSLFLIALLVAVPCFGQHSDSSGAADRASVSVGRANLFLDRAASVPHPYHIVARHPKAGCLVTAECGEVFYQYDGINLRTSAGTTWQSSLMGNTSTPTVNAQCNWIALTNTAITAAEADTTLSGEIVSNGLTRLQATYADASTTLTVPAAPTLVVTGGAGGTAQFYFVEVCNQGICTTPSVASSSATPNATLDTTHYITGTFTGQNGAATYVVIRSNSSSTPSGSLAGGATQSSTGQVSGASVSCNSALSCTFVDNSNTVAAYTVPASNVTNFGKYTLIKTWTATGGQSAQAFGIFTASSSGTMCFEGTFTQVTLNTNDTFQLTESVFF